MTLSEFYYIIIMKFLKRRVSVSQTDEIAGEIIFAAWSFCKALYSAWWSIWH